MASIGPTGGGLRDRWDAGGLSPYDSSADSSWSRKSWGTAESLEGLRRVGTSSQFLELGRPPSSSGEEAMGAETPTPQKF